MTVHAAIYHPKTDSLAELLKTTNEAMARAEPDSVIWARLYAQQAATKERIAAAKRTGGTGGIVRFTSPVPDNATAEAEVVIIDEASMVDQRLLEHTRVYAGEHTARGDAHIVMIGDVHQLPPVGPHPSAFDRYDVELTEIMRADDQLLPLVREMYLAFSNPAKAMIANILTSTRSAAVTRVPIRSTAGAQVFAESDVILCYAHQSVHVLNAWKRRVLGISGPPQVGEPIISFTRSTKHDYRKNELFVIRAIADTPDLRDWIMTLEAQAGGRTISVPVAKSRFSLVDDLLTRASQGSVPSGDWSALKHMARGRSWGFAYAINTHSAQGGEWDTVAIADDSAWMDHREQSGARNSFLYTSSTRARSRVVYAKLFAKARTALLENAIQPDLFSEAAPVHGVTEPEVHGDIITGTNGRPMFGARTRDPNDWPERVEGPVKVHGAQYESMALATERRRQPNGIIADLPMISADRRWAAYELGPPVAGA